MGLAPTIALALCLQPALPASGRPTLSGPELTYLSKDGRIKFHYTLEGIDALAETTDVDPANGVPDTLDWAEEGAARMLDTFVVEDGWPLPPADGGVGGDDRLDIYFRAIDARGYTYLENLAGDAYSTYIDIGPIEKVNWSREAFESIVGHEVHHALEVTAASGTFSSSWIAEGSATWAQYLVFDGDEAVVLAQAFLFYWRVAQSARDLDDSGHGDLFEYAAGLWVKFLVDRGGGDRKLILDLWKKMGAARGYVAGHDAFVAAHLPGLTDLDDAVAEYALWNLFICAGDDGKHYAPIEGMCRLNPAPPVLDASPTAPTTSATIGERGSGYLGITPDCKSADLHLNVEGNAAPMRYQLVAVVPGGATQVQSRDAQANGSVSFDLPSWNLASRVRLVGTNRGRVPSSFRVTATVNGSYAAPSTRPPVATLTIKPETPTTLAAGTDATVRALAGYGTCADGHDATAEVTWRSSDERVATVTGGVIRAVSEGSAMITAIAGGVTSNAILVEVTANPDSGGCSASGAHPEATPDLFTTLIVLLILMTHRIQTRVRIEQSGHRKRV